MTIHVHIDAPSLHGKPIGLIGDTLAMVPFLLHFQKPVHVSGLFNRHVIPLLGDVPLTFDPDGSGAGADFTIGAQRLRDYCQATGWRHMAQGYFHQFGLPVPFLPITLPLVSSPCDFPPGIILSPFSVSDIGGNKVWMHERWVYVIQTLRRLGLADRVYVVGSWARGDSTSPYAVAGIRPMLDRPLTEVLDLLRKAPLVLSIDNGISHLAHFGGVTRHVMVYPDCLSPRWAEAPMASHVRGSIPASISVDQVLESAKQVLTA